MLRIEAFGELTVVRDGRRVEGGSAGTPLGRALVTLLACYGAAGVTRERAASLLLPDDALDPDGWWRSVVREVHTWLGQDHLVDGGDHLALAATTASSDVVDFSVALAAGALERAVQLHHGRLVDGLHHREAPAFERWLQLQREALASDAASALERLAEEATRRGEPLTAVRWWRQLSMQYPLNHRIAASLMEALIAAGDREGALRHARFLEALADERLALPGDEQVLAMAQSLRAEGTRSGSRKPVTIATTVQAGTASDPLADFRRAIAERYRIEGEVGRGGHGAVLRATDLRHERPVAIKVLHPELAPALSTTRFAREIRLVSALHHPNILPLYDSGCEGGTLFFVMPLVQGASLRERLRRDGALPVREALSIARQVTAALGEAHRRSIIHRDIKPENILLTGPAALLADFGIACAVDSATDAALTAPGMVVGTPAYMSPEQASPQGTVDARADVYSLGCVLFEMLTGSAPFSGDSPHAILAGHATASVPTVTGLRPDTPAAVDHIVRRALQKNPEHRFESADAFERALESALLSAGRAEADSGHISRGAARRIAVVLITLVVLAGLALAPPMRGVLSPAAALPGAIPPVSAPSMSAPAMSAPTSSSPQHDEDQLP